MYFQLLNLLDVIIDSAGSKSSPSDKSLIPASKPSSGPQTSAVEAETKVIVDDSTKPTTSDNNMEYESPRVLSNLPQAELRLLCSLLAQEGYAYGCRFVLILLSMFCGYAYFLFVYLPSLGAPGRGVGTIKNDT